MPKFYNHALMIGGPSLFLVQAELGGRKLYSV